MKKYMIPALAFLLATGAANAQVQKSVAKTTTPKQVSARTTSAASGTAATSVSPKPATSKKTMVPIKRKHHHKSKAAKKVENK
ncbi:hypothetical protein [Terrimonas pollutisoli]|uniref:hypothetical protein n=1 Tax=Terrimonas pollutisoli TaxID=3034147 RepID=UPI0023EB34EE|nr:hypothetical protein [Terrimonas sp. H1YJ31]